MKRLTMILLIALTAVSAFAYEPSKENVTVKGNKYTYEYVYKGIFGPKTSSFTYNIKTKKVVLFKTGTTDYMWTEVSNCRDAYKACSYLATVYPEHSNALVNFVNKYGDVDGTVDGLIESQSKLAGTDAPDDASSASYQRSKAEDWKNQVLNRYPFFTEENWLTLTEEEWFEMLSNFCTKQGENEMIAELVLTLALAMFPIQLPMTEKAYNDLQTIEVANTKTAADWFYRNKEENKWLDVNGLIVEDLDNLELAHSNISQ